MQLILQFRFSIRQILIMQFSHPSIRFLRKSLLPGLVPITSVDFVSTQVSLYFLLLVFNS